MSRVRRKGLVLPVFWLWAASLAFRGLPRGNGFSPGLRNVVAWYRGRLSYALFNRDRLHWWRARWVRFLRRLER
jgi:hypothetical protein